jgi:hypothetical protein
LHYRLGLPGWLAGELAKAKFGLGLTFFSCYKCRYFVLDGGGEFQRRMAAAMGLLIASKFLTIQVPFLFKYTGK